MRASERRRAKESKCGLCAISRAVEAHLGGQEVRRRGKLGALKCDVAFEARSTGAQHWLKEKVRSLGNDLCSLIEHPSPIERAPLCSVSGRTR